MEENKEIDPLLKQYFDEVLNQDGFFGPWENIRQEDKDYVEQTFSFLRYKRDVALRRFVLAFKKEIGLTWLENKIEKWIERN